MKKIVHLIGIFTVVLFSNIGNAQISDYEICDVNADGYGAFDLTTKIDEILDGANPNDYVVTFHETENDAQSDTNPITDPFFYNMIPYVQVMYVRIENLNDSTFEVESFNLVVYSPQIGTPDNLFSYDGIFDLTINDSLITQGNSYTVSYFLTEINAYDNVSPITNPTTFFSVTNPTISIWARAEDTNGCFSVISFEISNIVYIPDFNFKAKLLQASTGNFTAIDINGNSMVVDANSDGEIQVSEALNVYQLNVWGSYINNLTGIESFTNLTHLSCYSNNLTELDISNKVNLVSLSCSNNNLTELDISNNVNLVGLSCGENLLSELDISNNLNLETIYCGNNNLTELDVSNQINLIELHCSFNKLTELDITNNINLTKLTCYFNELTDLNVSNNTELITLECNGNSLGELDVFNNTNLTSLHCGKCWLSELDVSNNTNLTNFSCGNQNLTELDLSNNINLVYFYCNGLNLTELDLSNQLYLEAFNLNNNPQLTYINIKNGGNLSPQFIINSSSMWGSLPDNIYICADEEEAANIAPYLNQSGATGQVIATYCYIPGGNYNTITGSVFFNSSGSCNEDDIIILSKVTIDDGTEQGVSFTNQDGEYTFFTQDGTFTLTPDIENPSYFNITPITETVVFADNDNNEEIVNFCITPNGVHNDLEVVVAPIIPARPGFEATYKIVYRNKGNQVMSQTNGISFTYDDDYLDFVSATQTPSVQSTGLLMWSYENLMPFESRSFVITMQVNSPTNPDFPVNIDDVFMFTAVILPQTDDENEYDNIYGFRQIVIGSYDPNDITCIEGDVIEPEYIGEELHYVIRFENTGNYYAENIVVAMEIDTLKYDVDSVRLLNTSHNANAQIKDNVLEVFFNQIMLDSGGHGNILLVMKSVSSLSEGDSVQSKADIYFDYNYPIITNDAVTVFQATMSIEDNIQNIDVRFYPNPTTDYFNITSEAMIQSVELYDVSGRLVRTSLVNDFDSKQNISNLDNGVYILKIKTEQGEVTGKIVKK